MYVDTSVFGALYDLEDSLRVEVTKELLELLKSGVKYTPFISNVVIEEIEKAPLNIRTSLLEVIRTTNIDILYETEDCIDLVTEYLKKKIIPNKYRDDGRHIAVAVVNDADVIVSWNCRHMANIEKKKNVQCSKLIFRI
jgi:predicted nucleic acid-binding protein